MSQQRPKAQAAVVTQTAVTETVVTEIAAAPRAGERHLVNRRKRFDARLAVRCVADGQAREVRTGNISEGGAFILSGRPPAEGTLVSLSLGAADPKLAVDVDAEVMWRGSNGAGSGFGVRFLLCSTSLRKSVSELVASAALLSVG